MSMVPLKSLLPGYRTGLPSADVLDTERLRIDAALAHIQECGNLDNYPSDRSERRALMITAVRRGLVAWDRRRERYELTGAGKSQLAGLELAGKPDTTAFAGTAIQSRGPGGDTPARDNKIVPDRPPVTAGGYGEGRGPILIAAVVAMAACTGVGALLASARMLPGRVQDSASVTAPSGPGGPAATAVGGRPSPDAPVGAGAPPAATSAAQPGIGAAAGVASMPANAGGAPIPSQTAGVPGAAGLKPSTPWPDRTPREPTSDGTALADPAAQTSTTTRTGEPAAAAQNVPSGRHPHRHGHYARGNRRDDERREAAGQDGFWGPQGNGALAYNGRDGVEGRASRARRETRRSDPDREATQPHSGGRGFGTDAIFGWLFR